MGRTRITASVAALATIAALSGCATTSAKRAETYSIRAPEMSLARNVALHTSLTKEKGPLVDVDRAALGENLRGASDHQLANHLETAGWAGLGVAHLNGFALPPGLSPAAAVGLDIFGGLFVADRLAHPALAPQTLAWMPKGKAPNRAAARSLLEKLLKEAFLKSVPAGFTYQERIVTKKPTFGSPFQEVYGNLIGPGCPREDGLECRVHILVKEPTEYDAAPEWSGVTGPAYRWANWLDGSNAAGSTASIIISYAEPDKWHSKARAEKFIDQRHALVSEMSKHLPEWVFLYAPPTKATPYPAIYRGADTLLFVTPRPQ